MEYIGKDIRGIIFVDIVYYNVFDVLCWKFSCNGFCYLFGIIVYIVVCNYYIFICVIMV